jgi:hypothetical protein
MSPLIDALPDELMKDQSAAANDQAMSPVFKRGWRSISSWRLCPNVCERRKTSHRREDAPNEANDQKHAHDTILKHVRLIGREIVGRLHDTKERPHRRQISSQSWIEGAIGAATAQAGATGYANLRETR